MAHCNTIFNQMLKLIPRHHFDKLEAEHGTGRKPRSFTRWSQLVHLISMQLTARVYRIRFSGHKILLSRPRD